MRWIAAIDCASSTMARASRAAIEPMLTLSWLWASVEREWTLAGLDSFSASAVVHDELELRVHQVAQVGDGDLQRVHRLGHVAAVEVAAALGPPAVRVEQRVV